MPTDVQATIPHRPPFLFLDRVDELRADGAVCSRTFRAEEPFYAGHYPGNPITPGVLLRDSWADLQKAGVKVLGVSTDGEKLQKEFK
ncbi:MAG: hypothetical protein ACKOIB_03735, partial [Verrucomicrobiota bacterium]